MTKPVRVPDDVHETLKRISARHDVSMSEAARLALGDGLDDGDGTVLMTRQELENRLEERGETAIEAFRAGYENGVLESLDESETGAVKQELGPEDREVLVADRDRFLDELGELVKEQDRYFSPEQETG